ncbi:retropepsin-like aspartic protease family protein [Rhodobacter capsulatus]|uniref:retropepsin-like aspartic protease family protein n=1 Tax=Rhodobacter capsulatus TaxID=1061 RepID=UPI0040261627
MDPDIPRVIYYLLLLLAIGGYLVAALRRRPGQALQQLMIWALIFLGVVAVAGIWPDVRAAILPEQTVTQSGRIELPLRADGHYYLQAQVNGATIDFVIDTGASQIVLSRADAERAGIDTGALAYIGRAFTANGEVATAPVRLDSLSVGPLHRPRRGGGGQSRRHGGLASGHELPDPLRQGAVRRPPDDPGTLAPAAPSQGAYLCQEETAGVSSWRKYARGRGGHRPPAAGGAGGGSPPRFPGARAARGRKP